MDQSGDFCEGAHNKIRLPPFTKVCYFPSDSISQLFFHGGYGGKILYLQCPSYFLMYNFCNHFLGHTCIL